MVMELDRERRDAAQVALRAAGIDALVCRLPEHIVLLSGYYPNVGASLIVFPAEGEPTLILPRFEREFADRGFVADQRFFDTWQNRYPPPPVHLARILADVLSEKNLQTATIGYEGGFEQFAPNMLSGEPTGVGTATQKLIQDAATGARLLDATNLLNQLRARKTATEIARLRIANEVAAMGLVAFKAAVHAGMTEAAVSAAVESTIRRDGCGYKNARFAFGWAQVTSGLATAQNWGYPVSSARKLETGDLVVIELGVVVDGYWADLTRTVSVGPATERQREVYQVVERAKAASLAAVGNGVSGVAADKAGRDVITAAGYADNFVHHTGHGIGFRYHEPIPFVAPHSVHSLEIGHVFSIEPGIYIEGFGGIRLEDNCALLPSGGEYLAIADILLD